MEDENEKILISDYRCANCGRLLFRAHIPNVPGIVIEVRCNYEGCRRFNIFRSTVPENASRPVILKESVNAKVGELARLVQA